MLKRTRRGWIGVRLRSALVLLLAVAAAGCGRGAAAPGAPQPYEGTALDGPAPDFRLVDQKGATVALSDFRGKAVVLAFLDAQCKEVCPLTAAELRKVYRALGQDAASVVFLGINVNARANAVADAAKATDEWRLSEIPTWHFLTGRQEALAPVLKAYGIAVMPEESEIMHTPGVYVIDRAGQLRWYVNAPLGYKAGQDPSLSDLLPRKIRQLLK